MSYIVDVLSTDPIRIVFTILGAGGAVTWFLQYLGQRSNQKHQLFLNIAETKFEKIQKSSNDYILFASCAREVHELLCSPVKSDERCFFYACKFFFYYSKIVRDYAGFELDDLNGERALTFLMGDIINLIRKGSSHESVSIMADSGDPKGDHDLNYDKFKPRLDNNEIPFSNEFYKIISDECNRQKLHDYFLWLYQLLYFEVNYAYRLWYGKEEKFTLNPAFKEYLKNKNLKSLVIRLKTVGKNWFSRQGIKIKYKLSQ